MQLQMRRHGVEMLRFSKADNTLVNHMALGDPAQPPLHHNGLPMRGILNASLPAFFQNSGDRLKPFGQIVRRLCIIQNGHIQQPGNRRLFSHIAVSYLPPDSLDHPAGGDRLASDLGQIRAGQLLSIRNCQNRIFQTGIDQIAIQLALVF